MYACICMCIYAYIYAGACMHGRMNIQQHVHVCTCHVWVWVCASVCVYTKFCNTPSQVLELNSLVLAPNIEKLPTPMLVRCMFFGVVDFVLLEVVHVHLF